MLVSALQRLLVGLHVYLHQQHQSSAPRSIRRLLGLHWGVHIIYQICFISNLKIFFLVLDALLRHILGSLASWRPSIKYVTLERGRGREPVTSHL